MPIYEYICKNCDHKFEAMRSFNDADAPIRCNQCGSEDTRRMVSTCFCKSDSGSYSVSATTSGGGCSGCSGGNCAHCGH